MNAAAAGRSQSDAASAAQGGSQMAAKFGMGPPREPLLGYGVSEATVLSGGRRAQRVGAGLALGVLSGALAQRASGLYGDDSSGDLRATAHVGLPFLVAATASGGSPGSVAHQQSEELCRAAFIGVHLVHLRLIVDLLRGGGLVERRVRLSVLSGVPNYGLLAVQCALSTRLVSERVGLSRAEAWRRLIDDQLLAAYAAASLIGLVRHRRPLFVYAAVGAIFGFALVARRGRGSR